MGIREVPDNAFEVDANVIAGMRAFGATAADILAAEERMRAAAQPTTDVFGLWHDTVDAFDAFMGVATQWHYAGMQAQRTGLDYAGVAAYLSLTIPKKKRAALFIDLRLMERAVLSADCELQKKRT